MRSSSTTTAPATERTGSCKITPTRQSLNGTLLRRIVRDNTWHDKSTDARGFVTHTDYNENRQVIVTDN